MKKSDKNLSKNYRLRQTSLVLLFRIFLVELFFALIAFFPRYILFESGEFSSPTFFWILRIANLCFIVAMFLRWQFTYYVVSTDALSTHRGFLFNRLQTFDLQSIRSVKVQQGLIGKVFDFGDIIMESPLLEKHVVLKNISNPIQHAKTVDVQRLKILENKDASMITPVI